MIKISSGAENMYKAAGRAFERFAKIPLIAKNIEEGRVASIAARLMLYSIVSKDLVGCAIYTTQSLNNKEIPEEKRKFVAALDLMNGLIMVGGQLLAGLLIEKTLIPKWFGKIYSGTLKNKNTGIETPLLASEAKNARLLPDNIYSKVIKHIKKKGIKGIDADSVKRIANAVIKDIGPGSTKFSAIGGGFTIALIALTTNAFVKRTLAPLFATPAAAWFKDKFMDDKKGSKSKITENKTPQEKSPAELEADSAIVLAPWNNNAKNPFNIVSEK